MLKISNLHASIEGKEILKGIDLEIKPGEIHAIMGPNGSGKSTLSQVLAGNENFEVTEGTVFYQGEDLLEKETTDRALDGIFLAFQYPVEIPGISNEEFMRQAVNAGRKHRGESELDAFDFASVAKGKIDLLELKADLLERSLNVGFSGGEKKRNEIFQMAMLEPKLAILDETDSGLDIDALRVVAHGVNSLRSADRSFLVITHYQRLLEYIVPDHVHVLSDGRIVKSGGKELALELEEKGYGWLEGDTAALAGKESS
jgi:Fe-S cluster assembly ATP-binding protein